MYKNNEHYNCLKPISLKTKIIVLNSLGNKSANDYKGYLKQKPWLLDLDNKKRCFI